MYVNRLEIENYRNFKNFSIDLKPLTLVIGENNVGKSNLLDSLGLIFSQEVSFFKKRTLEVSDFNYDSIVALKRKILDSAFPIEDIEYPFIKISATLTDWNLDQESVISEWFCNEDYTEAKLTYTFSPVSTFNKAEEIQGQRDFIQKYKEEISEDKFSKLKEKEVLDLINFPISRYHYSIIGGNQNDTQANIYHLNQLKFELLDALRDAKSELTASHNNRLLFRVLNSKDENEYQDLKTQLVGLQDAIEKNDAIKSIKEGISTQLDKISLSTDDSKNIVDLIFSIPNIEDLLKKLSLIYGEDPVRIERNGTGRNNLLFISLILSFIEDPKKAQTSFFRIVGIEEPESHLHANLQNHLANNIEQLIKENDSKDYRKDIQLILTSHSNHISTKIDFDNTVVLYHKGDLLTPHYILSGFKKDAHSTKMVRYLRKYLDAENINLFYSKKIVLVEGISEKLLFPIFYKIQTTQTIEETSCSVVSVNGLAFKNFLEIIRNGFHTKCLVLTDSDKDTKAEDRAENLDVEYKGVPEIDIRVSSKSTFEKDLIASNNTGGSKNILLEVIKIVRPNAGKEYADKLGEDDIEVEGYFQLIEKFKSDFAYQLMIRLEKDSTNFNVPEYILNGIIYLTT
ncbi:AAA family ATPase [Labilibaculum sp. A4]|uniref:ATP-dependent nuclease n=1 Tax=Labilibaculum euxinus TaxID=2686357 RepID=UPI000F62026D|nr:AAA family ATPase [Labilibaculum euxinus]MDQ1772558.1 AAA family ATPase [Labilibaculum euxinus]MWN78600.1 AAA family ATPase [Labilibaculum euxinus]